MSKHSWPPMTLLEYERAFRVMHGILLSENADVTQSCLFFAFAGAAILRLHHELPAQVVVGAAAYKLATRGKEGIAFGMDQHGKLNPGLEKFHAWVQVDDWHIDFIAPLFREGLEGSGFRNTLARKMFQKRLPEMGRLERVGDFISQADDDLIRHCTKDFFSMPAREDLVRIGMEWYRRPPKQPIPVLGVADQHGKVKPVPLSPLRLVGAW